MRFRDDASGRYVSIDVALSNPDQVVPLDDRGRVSPEITIEWARLVTALHEIGKVAEETPPMDEPDGLDDGFDEFDLGEEDVTSG